jgi:hypothetical protein
MMPETTVNEVSMHVTRFTDTKLKINPDRGVAFKDTAPTLRWIPASGLTIEYVGFNNPVGDNHEIGVPQKDPSNPGHWIATNKNTRKDLFSYSVWARLSDGRVLSTDPQIENEGKEGGTEENGEPGGGG